MNLIFDIVPSCSYISVSTLLCTSRTAVLVNGCPGPWITCRRGLRQGDPMSSYLFLLVADVLQALIKKDATVHNPLDSSSPCPVLQYADDTLILLRGKLADVRKLKHLLDQFSAATGLRINYHKSTAVPMHMREEDIPDCIAELGCRREGFHKPILVCLCRAKSCVSRLLIRTSAKLTATWLAGKQLCLTQWAELC